VRVRLVISADAPFTWVVVNDPVPAGASHLGAGLGTGAPLLDAASPARPNTEPTFVERSFEGLRAYYEFLPAGDTTLDYTVRLNQAGTFRLPPTHVEAMYNPDVAADLPLAPVVIEP
jgi:alpha-2-macroglobulin